MQHLEVFGEHSILETFSADVTDQGDVASFRMRYSGLPEFRVAVKIEELGLSMHMLRSTAAKMIRKRAAWPDKGRSVLMETAENAILPTKTDVILNPMTGDRTIVVQSGDTAPIAIRLTPFEADILLDRLVMLRKVSQN